MPARYRLRRCDTASSCARSARSPIRARRCASRSRPKRRAGRRCSSGTISAWASSGAPSADPWVTLGACAARTSRILLGTAVTPVPRRRVQNLAQELATLSLASGGRVVFGAGLGGRPEEFAAFGEETDERVRARLLDDGLQRLDGLLRGEPLAGRRRARAAAAAAGPVLDRRHVRPGAAAGGALGRLARRRLRSRAERRLAGRACASSSPATRIDDVAFIGYSQAGRPAPSSPRPAPPGGSRTCTASRTTCSAASPRARPARRSASAAATLAAWI